MSFKYIRRSFLMGGDHPTRDLIFFVFDSFIFFVVIGIINAFHKHFAVIYFVG